MRSQPGRSCGGARLLKAAGAEDVAQRWITDGIRWLTAGLDADVTSPEDLSLVTGTLKVLRALQGATRANCGDIVGLGDRASVRSALRLILREQLTHTLDPAQSAASDVAPLLNAHAQMVGRDPYVDSNDGELIGRLLRLHPDALMTLSTSIPSLRGGHTPMRVATHGEAGVHQLLREVRAALQMRSGVGPLPDGVGAPRLPVPAAADLDDAKRRLAGVLDNTLSSAYFDPATIPTVTVAVERRTLDEFIALGYRPVLIEQVASLGDFDGHRLEGVQALSDDIPRERGTTEADIAAREARWHLGAIAHYDELPVRDTPGRTAPANALVVLAGAPAAKDDLVDVGQDADSHVWPRAALTIHDCLYGPTRPTRELSVTCAHENTRWLPARCLERGDTMMLCCVDCQRRGFASVPTHQLPDGHPDLPPLTDRSGADQRRYLAGESALRQIAGHPPLPGDMSIMQLRAADGSADLDAVAVEALDRTRPRPSTRRTMRTTLNRAR